VGAKLEFNPSKIPLKMQLAVYNGILEEMIFDVDSKKTSWPAATYSLHLQITELELMWEAMDIMVV